MFNASNTFKPDMDEYPLISVSLSKVVNLLTFNEDKNVVLLFIEVNPLTFNDDHIVDL